jgi:two-component system NtrC family sensor kinase
MRRLIERYLKYFLGQRSLRFIIFILVILLAAAVLLSVLSSHNMKGIISEDFNSQQLELAKHAAGILTENFKILKRELTTLSLSPSIQYIESVSWANRMKITFSTVREYGVIKIMLVEREGERAFATDYTNAVFLEKADFSKEEYFEWCKMPKNTNRVYVSSVKRGIVMESEPGFVKLMAVPVYQVSSDEAHPTPTQEFTGALVFVLDTAVFAKKVVGPIRSGKTGYAWVINDTGKFLYHLDKDFIGQDAFEVRRFKDPHISFSEINLIQKDLMLQGKEGTSWYISGWHRGKTGKMKKLIAYAPVHIGAANTQKIWSVAVVAPISEVEDAVQSIYLRQSLLQGAIIVAVVIVLAFYIAMERVWRRTLENVVEEKTSDLEEYAQELRRSEERYRSVIESADDMIYTLDKDCKILSVNRYYTRLTGQGDDDAVGKRITGLIQYDDPKTISNIVEKVLNTSRTVNQEEHVKIGEKEHWFDTKYKPLMMGEDRTNAVLVISRDITKHKSMETQLLHTEKLASLGSLSAGVAHEMNNPIAIILGFTEILLEKFPEGSKEHEILKTIERQGTNCQKIVENLLKFARIPEKTTIETDAVEDLQRVLKVVMNTLVTKKIDVQTELKQDLPKVRGDGRQLEQVFLNIINNGAASMEGGGLLKISARFTDHMVSIAFTDTGHGIPREHLGRIFEPFFTTKKVGEGTGLGLSVSYGIIKKYGGDIRVNSQTGDKGKASGSTFTVLLPVVDSDNGES